MKASRLYSVQCISPVHIGTGQGVGVIDMPMMRERVTEWPLIPGSSMKGARRDDYTRKGRPGAWLHAAFGKRGDQDGNAGAIVFSDCRMFAFPLASRCGVFAYVTCPLAIDRLSRDAAAVGCRVPAADVAEWRSIQGHGHSGPVIVGSESVVVHEGNVIIDEFQFQAKKCASFGEWAGRIAAQFGMDSSSLARRLALVSDEAFHYFVTMCCETTPRIRINSETSTVEDGALWYEEYLPAETIMYGIVWCDRIPGASPSLAPSGLLDELAGEVVMQIGGNTSVGKGLVKCACVKEGER